MVSLPILGLVIASGLLILFGWLLWDDYKMQIKNKQP